jgi:D-arabinose 5-phosphate isomerase GutQ
MHKYSSRKIDDNRLGKPMENNEILAAARAIIEQESAAVAALKDQLNDRFVRVARRLLVCEGHVLVTGAGTSYAIATRLAHLLTCCGTPALPVTAGETLHGMAGTVTIRDVLIAISKGGETAEINFFARYAHEHGVSVIAFTESGESTLARLSDEVLLIRTPAEVDQLGYIATGSSLVAAAMGDALCGVLLRLREHSLDSFAATHPGGAVGQKLYPTVPPDEET